MFAPSCITLLDDYRGFFPGRAPGEDGKFLLDVSTIFRKCFHNIWKRPLIQGHSWASTLLYYAKNIATQHPEGLTMFKV